MCEMSAWAENASITARLAAEHLVLARPPPRLPQFWQFKVHAQRY